MKLTGNLLLIDDDRNFLQLIELILATAGHRTTTASNWPQVMANLNRAVEAGRAFDMIFLDLMMPERSGMDILRSLRVVLHPLPPVVVLTAFSDPDTNRLVQASGAVRVLQKPATAEQLLGTVRELLEAQHANAA